MKNSKSSNKISFSSKTMFEKYGQPQRVFNIYPNLKGVSLSSIKSVIEQDEEYLDF